MSNIFDRTEKLLGEDGMRRLKSAHVCVFGVGGVGSYIVEALARSGVGAITVVDKDVVDITNINRQLVADISTVGRAKVEVAKERILRVNPDCEVHPYEIFYLPGKKQNNRIISDKESDIIEENLDSYSSSDHNDNLDFSEFDYVVDAVDNVTAKLYIIEQAKAAGVPVISAMGTGNKLDPTRFMVADISETSVCPLARVMRNELKKRGISGVKVVYSDEKPINSSTFTTSVITVSDCEKIETINKKEENPSDSVDSPVISSIAFVPSVAGLIMAGEVVKDIAGMVQ